MIGSLSYAGYRAFPDGLLERKRAKSLQPRSSRRQLSVSSLVKSTRASLKQHNSRATDFLTGMSSSKCKRTNSSKARKTERRLPPWPSLSLFFLRAPHQMILRGMEIKVSDHDGLSSYSNNHNNYRNNISNDNSYKLLRRY